MRLRLRLWSWFDDGCGCERVVISCDRDCGCGWLRLRFVVGMVVGVIAFVTVHALLWERSTRIELCYRPLNPRGGGRRTKPCDHTALLRALLTGILRARRCVVSKWSWLWLAVCRCSCGVVVTDFVCLLCLWSWCGGGYDQGYLASELLSSLRLADLLQSTWIVEVGCGCDDGCGCGCGCGRGSMMVAVVSVL